MAFVSCVTESFRIISLIFVAFVLSNSKIVYQTIHETQIRQPFTETIPWRRMNTSQITQATVTTPQPLLRRSVNWKNIASAGGKPVTCTQKLNGRRQSKSFSYLL